MKNYHFPHIKLLALFAALVLWAFTASSQDWKAKYDEKVKVNNDTIGVIAGVINDVCPKLVKDAKKICNAKDPVGSAVKIEQLALGEKDIDDLFEMEDEEQNAYLTSQGFKHPGAAVQMVDAVDQFKKHFEAREVAKDMASKKKWQEAFLNEEQVFQYLVKTASRGVFAQKMVNGE